MAKGHGVSIQPPGGYIFSYEERNGIKRPMSILENVNVQACAILEHCTGSKTTGEIADILEGEFEDVPPDLLSQVETFLNTALEKGYITYSKAPARMEGIIQGSIAFYTPSQILIEVTSVCNLKCAHCLVSAGRSSADELSGSQFIKIADHFSQMGVRRLTLSGGEILAAKDWESLLDFCVRRFDSVLLTNGILITGDVAKKLAQCREVYVSLYGANAQTYEKFSQVEGSFERALRGIALLTEQNIPVSASVPMTPFNLEELEEIVALAISLKCSTVRVGTVIPLGRARARQWGLTEEQKERVNAHMNHLRQKYKDAIEIQWEEDFEKEEHTCGAGYERWAVASNGDVYPCVLFRIPIGNLIRQDPITICTSSAVRFLQEAETPHQGMCGDCRLLPLCKGCHGQAYAHYSKADQCGWAQQFKKAPSILKNAVLQK